MRFFILFCLIAVLGCARVYAAAPSLENYEVTRLDLRGDVIRDIQVHPTDTTIVYLVGQNGGVFKSTDSGATWNRLLRIDGRGIALDRRNPDTIYAGGFGGVQKSTDGGKTWNLVLKAKLRSLGVHPVSGVVMAGGDSGTVHRSEDGGATWTQLKLYTTGEINKWAFHPTNANILYHSAAKNRGVYKSTDGGKNWRQVSDEYGRCVAISLSNPNVLYASTQKSTDGGETWTSTGGGQAWAVVVHPKNPDVVFKASQGDAVFRTTNGGWHWTQMKGLTRGGLTDLTAHWSIAIDAAKDILYVGAAVLYKADQASARDAALYESSQGIAMSDVVSISGTKNVLWAGTDGQGVVRSLDFGRTWERKLLGLRGKLNLGGLKIHPLDNEIVYSTGEGGLVKTTNGGKIWLHMPLPPGGGVRSVVPDAQDKAGVFTIAEQKLYHSRDGGFSWQEWEKARGKDTLSFSLHPVQPRVMFLQTKEGWQRSEDAGQNWHALTLPDSSNLHVSKNPATPNTYYAVQSQRFLLKSSDAGKNWEKIHDGGRYGEMAEAGDGTLWIAAGGQVHRSLDAGKTWQSLALDLELRKLLVDPHNPQVVFVAAKGGLFRVHPKGAVQWASLAPAKPTALAPATITLNAPGVLDRANTVYKLGADIKSHGTAFYVIADDITIDGGGHAVEFDLSAVEANGVRNLTVKKLKAKQSGQRSGASHGSAPAFDLMFCPGATLSNLTIETALRGSNAISVSGANGTIINNTITRMGPFATAINVEGAGARVVRNTIDASNSGRGIAVSDAENAQITDNQITYGGPTPVAGLTLNVASGARVQSNVIRGSGRGVATMVVAHSNGVSIMENQITSSSTLLHLDNSQQVSIRNNKLDANGENLVLHIEKSSGATVSGNEISITALTGAAIVFNGATDNTMSDNRWRGADPLAGATIQQRADSKGNIIRSGAK